MAQLKNTIIDDTGSLTLPDGTTGQRPSPLAGQARYNTTTGKIEIYNSSINDWVVNSPLGVVANGGDSVYDINSYGTIYRVHVFTSTGNSTFTVTKGGEVEYLIVAGGGGGGLNAGGGAGAGGLLTGTVTVSTQNYTISVGAGGAGGTGGGAAPNGQNSSAFGLTAIGGGGGVNGAGPGADGGSGGGGALSGSNPANGGSGTSGQGNSGGTGLFDGGVPRTGGGGGGAGGPGADTHSATRGGDGGPGLITSITGYQIYYAGGGGGASHEGATFGFGGPGGGGNAGLSASVYNNGNTIFDGEPGSPNTGGGGGAGAGGGRPGGAGGSGIVVIRYPLKEGNATTENTPVRDGLVLDLDFAKPTTYTGNNIVTDVTNGRQGIINNYSIKAIKGIRSHRAYVDLDEINSEVAFTNQFMDTRSVTNASYVFWINNNWSGKTGYDTVFGIQQSGFDRVATLVLNTGDNGIIGFDLRTSTNVRERDICNTDLKSFSNQWIHIAYTFDAGSHALYVNGSLASSENRPAITTFPNWVYNGGGGFAMGDNLASTRQHGGKFAVGKIYIKTLSIDEISNDYNATRWRFGV